METAQTTKPQPRFRNVTQWETLKEFRDPATGLTVKAMGRPGPEYMIQVSIVQQVAVENAQVKLQHHGAVVGRLYDEAQLYIQERRQAIVDEEIEDRQYREHREMERIGGSQKIVPGLSKFTPGSKTAKEEASGKRNKHEQNLQARQAADRERTQKTKGKS